MAHLKLKPKDTASEPIKTQGSLLYSEGQGARPSSSQAQIPFHPMHTAAVLSWDGYLGKGLRAGGLEKQDAFPLTRAILTQRLKQACSVPLPPGWESPSKTGSFSQWHPALAKDSLKPKLPRRHANSQEEAREAPNAAGVTQQEGRWLLAAAGDLSGCYATRTKVCVAPMLGGPHVVFKGGWPARDQMPALLHGDHSRQLGQ